MRRLVAYDGSWSARRALEHAVLLHRAGDELAVMHVAEDPRAATDDHLGDARRVLAERGIDALAIAAIGNPAHEICVAADRHGFDTILVGRRNIKDAGVVLLGSVASRVVGGATGNVAVVA